MELIIDVLIYLMWLSVGLYVFYQVDRELERVRRERNRDDR